MLGISCAIMPNTFYFQYFHSRELAWTAVVAAYVLMVLSRVTCFTSTFVLLNNAADASIRGSANGLAQTMGSVAGMLGPLVGSILFAWSLNNSLSWPLNFHFIWILLTIICLIGNRVATYVPTDAPTSSNATHAQLPTDDDTEKKFGDSELTSVLSVNDDDDEVSDLSDDELFVLQNLIEDDTDDPSIDAMQRLSLSVSSKSSSL
jgi:prenylcysteine oxidase/farnesylcysteine lyase